MQIDQIKGSAILVRESRTNAGELFESMLRELSACAFRCMVNSGVRDIDAFLMLDSMTLAGSSPRIAAELSAAQQRTRQRLCACSSSGPAYPDSESESTGDADDVESENVDDHGRLFQATVDRLGTRAQHALTYGRVKSLQQFMSLGPDVMVGWPNTGAKTIAEILDAQMRLNDVTRNFINHGKAPDPGGVRKCPKQPAAALVERVGQPSSADWRAITVPVEHGIDEPSTWSVLRKTIPDLLSLDGHVLDALWVAAGEEAVGSVVDLPEADWSRLAAAGIYKDDRIEVLLSLTLGYLVELKISTRMYDAIVKAVVTMVGASGVTTFARAVSEASDKPIMADSELASIRNFRIDSFDVPKEVLERLSGRGPIKWGSLTSRTERIILESSGLCLDALRQIRELWLVKEYVRKASMQVAGLPSEHFASFESMVQAFVDLVAKTPRERTVLLGRMGLLEDRKWTLDELGALLELTRERVRQIEQKGLKALRSREKTASLARFWMAVDETLHVAGGACLTGELGEQVAAKLDWKHHPNNEALTSLLQLSEHLGIDRSNDLVCDPDHRCLGCEAVVYGMEELFESDKSERPLLSVLEHLRSVCSQAEGCDEWSRSLSFSEGFICQIARKTHGVLAEDGVVYRRETRGTRRGSRVQLVERILRDAGRPMHFSEVYEQAKRLLPEDARVTEHNIYSWIGNSANLLLWDRGTYIHRELVDLPEELIGKIECWLKQKLESNVPFVSVAGAYSAFEGELMKAGISSESALYSCLRESGNDALNYPRYPYVVPNRPGCERLPVSIALEQYVLDAGGLVSFREIKAYAVDDLCIAEQMFAIHVYNVPNIIRAGKGSYIHVENLKLDHSKMAAIAMYAANLVSVDGHVSVEKVYSDKQISCLSMGVDSPEMLYAILQVHNGGGIRMPGYPQILSSAYQNADGGSGGVINEVADYIALREGPCSFDELEQHFVDELGYNAGTVYNVIIRDSVVRYSRGSLVHLDTIEWADDKQHQLETQAQDALDRVRKSGRCYALINQLIEYHTLPDLAEGIVWTQTLLSELLARGGRFGVLGSARNAFVAIPNDGGIETFEDLVYELLKTGYEGACELGSFEQDMREAGIVQKRVTPGMLGDQKKVRISGHLIMLRELCGRA